MKQWAMVIGCAALALGVLAGPAAAEGGKNRLSEVREDIEEGYTLCLKAGVSQVVIEEDGVTVVIDCPAPEFEE